MTTIRISITKEVLQATKDCKEQPGKNCAISYSVRLIWPYAHVDDFEILPFVRDLNRRRPLLELGIEHNQSDFVFRFDQSTPSERAAMQPFSFDIEVPDEVINEINIEEVRRICETSKTLQLC